MNPKFKAYKTTSLHGDFLAGYVILFVAKDFWMAAKGYSLYRYWIKERRWERFAILKDPKYGKYAHFRLMRRLMRAEIRNLYHLKNGEWMCIAKKGIFKCGANGGEIKKCCNIEKGSRPMVLCVDNNGVVYYGDYCYNPNYNEMQIHKSDDNGETWKTIFTFQRGEINHIHGIFTDPYIESRLWVATGDDDKACIFGYTDDGFKTFIRKFEGKQQYRVCVPMFLKDRIIYSTDSQYARNVIRRIERIDGKVVDLQNIEGSGIFSVQTNKWFACSTTVEPSNVNKDQHSYLWFSRYGETWKRLLSFKKDIWNTIFFQFGSIRFPLYEDKDSNLLIINGRALNKLDQSSLIINLKENNL